MDVDFGFTLGWRRLIYGARLALGLLVCFISIIVSLYYLYDPSFQIWLSGPALFFFGLFLAISGLAYLRAKEWQPGFFVRNASKISWLCFVIALVGVVFAIPLDNKTMWLVFAIAMGGLLYFIPFLFRRIRLNPHTRRQLFKVGGVGTLVFTIILSAGSIYLLATVVWAPRPLYLRTVKDPFVFNYEFNSTYGDMQETLEKVYPWFQPDPTNPENYAWGESYHLRNLIHFANTTQNFTLFTEAVRRIEIVMDHAYEGGGSEPGFGSNKYDKDPNTGEYIWVNYDVHDGVICLPIAEAAHIILNSKGSLHDAVSVLYLDNATRMLIMCEKIIQKWDRLTWVEGDGPYGRYGNYPSVPSGDTIYNRFAALGLLCVELYQITENTTYREKALMMGRTFKQGLVEYSYEMDQARHTLVIWPYKYEEPKGFWRHPGAEDISHGSIEVELAVKCFYLGGDVFSEAEMGLFANTFFDAIFKGLHFLPIFADNVDGFYPEWYEKMNSYQDVNAYASEHRKTLYFPILRQGWVMLHRFYRQSSWAHYVMVKGFEILIDAGYTSSVGVIGSLNYLLGYEPQ